MNINYIQNRAKKEADKASNGQTNGIFQYTGLATVGIVGINPSAERYKQITNREYKENTFHASPFIKEATINKSEGLKEVFYTFKALVTFDPKEEYNRIPRPPMANEDKLPALVTREIDIVFNSKLAFSKIPTNPKTTLKVMDVHGLLIEIACDQKEVDELTSLNQKIAKHFTATNGQCTDALLMATMTSLIKNIASNQDGIDAETIELFSFNNCYPLRKGEKDILDFLVRASGFNYPEKRKKSSIEKTVSTFNKTRAGSGDAWLARYNTELQEFDINFWRNRFNSMLFKAAVTAADKTLSKDATPSDFAKEFRDMMLSASPEYIAEYGEVEDNDYNSICKSLYANPLATEDTYLAPRIGIKYIFESNNTTGAEYNKIATNSPYGYNKNFFFKPHSAGIAFNNKTQGPILCPNDKFLSSLTAGMSKEKNLAEMKGSFQFRYFLAEIEQTPASTENENSYTNKYTTSAISTSAFDDDSFNDESEIDPYDL